MHFFIQILVHINNWMFWAIIKIRSSRAALMYQIFGDSDLFFTINLNTVFLPYNDLQFSRSVVSNSLRPHVLQHARPPCPSPTPEVYSNSCPLSRWCHPIISSSVGPFSSHLQSSPATGSFQMSQLFASGGQSFGVSGSTSVLPMNMILDVIISFNLTVTMMIVANLY